MGLPQLDGDGGTHKGHKNKNRNHGGGGRKGGNGGGGHNRRGGGGGHKGGRGGWSRPVVGPVSYDYGIENSRYEAGYHTGIDFGVAAGTRVAAVARGRVVESGWNDAYGWYIKIRHPNGYYSLYAHLRSRGVSAGDSVRGGQVIARSGASGGSGTFAPHLHFEIRKTTAYGSDVDPMAFIHRGARFRGGSGSGVGGSGGGGGGGGGTTPGFTRDKLSPQEMAERWGWAASFLKSDPELKKLFQQGTAQGWSQERFIAELRDTRWFQNHSADWRQAEYLRKTDPSTYDANVKEIKAQIADMAAEMGARLTKHELNNLAEKIYQFGYNDSQIRNVLANEVQRKNGSFLGEAGAVEDSLNQYAAAMGVRVANDFVKRAVQGMSSGAWSEQQIQDRIKKMSMSAFPSFRDEIEEGQTMADIASPYMQSMSAILELNPAEVDLFKPKIRQALTARDENGKPSPATLWDFETSLREDERWLSTKNGTEALAAAGSKVLQDFGFEAAF